MSLRPAILGWLLGLLSLACAAAQEPAAAVPLEQAKAWAERAAKMALAEASANRIHLQSQDGLEAKLLEQPVLKWSNTYDASVYGSALIWMHDGRPQVIACFYKFFTGDVKFDAEFHSLAGVPLVAVKQDQIVWKPAEPGIEFRPLVGGPAPAKTTGGRLIQMRGLARGFTAEMVTVVAKTRHKLRLLPQPLLRYGGESKDLLDGALFAFARETDPDVLLLLEASSPEEGEPAQWQYAVARMHVGELSVEREDKEVWRVPELAYPYARKSERYSLFQKLPEPKLD